MYHGEIKVRAYDVEAFLKAANKLKVRGLASDEPEQVAAEPAKAEEQLMIGQKSQPIDLCNDEFNISTDIEDDMLMEQEQSPKKASDDNKDFDTKESDVSNEDHFKPHRKIHFKGTHFIS